jgi:hypothetical protein
MDSVEHKSIQFTLIYVVFHHILADSVVRFCLLINSAFRSIARLSTVLLLTIISSERIGRKDASAVFNDAVSYLVLTASVG